MIKKRQMTNKLYGVNGGWARTRSVVYEGVGNVFDEVYHLVNPTVFASEWSDIVAWCVDTFGPSGTDENPGVWTPGERWYANNGKVWFREKADCEWFILRWS